MVLNSLLMRKFRQAMMAVTAGLVLAGCGEANAENNDKLVKAEVQPAAIVIETAEDIKRRCRALSHETDAQKDIKRACYAELKAKRQAEVVTLTEKLETEKRNNEEKRTTVEGLSKVLELQEDTPD